MDVAVEAKTRPLSTLSTFSHIPARRKELKEMSYFNTGTKVSRWNSVKTVKAHFGFSVLEI